MKDFQQILRICWFSSIEINSDYNTSSSSPSSPHPLLPLWLTSHSIPYNFFYLFLFSIFYEISSIGIMKIISKFYFSVSSQNHQLFLHCLWQSLLLITIISIFKSLKIYYCERIAIQSRYKLTNYLHYHLIGKHGICYFLQYENKNKIDNPDQRITQDIDKLTQEISTFLMNVISIPAILLFYSIYLWLTIGFFAPMMCYLYFIIGSLCSYFQAKRLVPLVYEQEKLEGNFRAGHVNYQTHLPSITLLRGEKDEEFRLQRNFSFLVKIASDIMKQELYLNLIVNWFSYFGSIVNYAVIGASVLYFSQLSNSSESDLASSLAAGSYACLYLISGLTTLLSTYESLSKIAALSSRVVELIEVTSLSRQRSEKVNQQGINRHFDEPQEQELELVSHSQDISIQSTSHVTNSPLIHVTKHTFTLPCRGIRCDVNFALTKGIFTIH